MICIGHCGIVADELHGDDPLLFLYYKKPAKYESDSRTEGFVRLSITTANKRKVKYSPVIALYDNVIHAHARAVAEIRECIFLGTVEVCVRALVGGRQEDGRTCKCERDTTNVI